MRRGEHSLHTPAKTFVGDTALLRSRSLVAVGFGNISWFTEAPYLTLQLTALPNDSFAVKTLVTRVYNNACEKNNTM